MNSVIDSVIASRRLKIFTAYYAIIYVVFNLLLNLLSAGVPFFKESMGRVVYVLIVATVGAPFTYGLIRGLVKKDYNVKKGLGAYSETGNYLTYGIYIAVTVAHEALGAAINAGGTANKDNAVLWTVLSAALTILKFFINMFVIRLFLDGAENGGRASFMRTLRACGRLLSTKPLKFIGAEAFWLVIGGASMVISTMLAGLLPAHTAVSLVVASLNSVQYGFIILSWPVYYLYYRWAFEE